MDGKLFGLASVVFTAGAPSYVFQNGVFTSTITDTATGNIALNMSQAVDASECAIVCTARATLAASGLVAFGVAHTSDVIKTITILNEGAMGAVSALADVNFDIIIAKLEVV